MIPWGFVVRTVLLTMAFVIVAVCIALLVGLFDPQVENPEIFKIIGPTFHDIVISFAVILSALASKLGPDKKEPPGG